MTNNKYRLKRELPQLPAGVIFEHRPYSQLKSGQPGSPACGAMVLGWLDSGTQGGWCGETYWLPGQLAQDREWFEPVGDTMVLLDRIQELKRMIEELEKEVEKKNDKTV